MIPQSTLTIRTVGDQIVTTIRMESGEEAFFAAGEKAIARMMIDYQLSLRHIRGLDALEPIHLDHWSESEAD